MSENIGDVVVSLKADFGETQNAFDSLVEQLKGMNAHSAEGKAAIAALSSSFEALLPHIEAMKTANVGAALSAEEFAASLDKGISEKFGASAAEDSAAALRLNEEALKASKDAAEEFDRTMGATTDSLGSQEEMTAAQMIKKIGPSILYIYRPKMG